MQSKPPYYWSLLALLLISSCIKFDLELDEDVISENTEETENLALTQIKFPDSFHFSTEKSVNISITDSDSNAFYELYGNDASLLEALDSITGPLPNRLFEQPIGTEPMIKSFKVSSFTDSLYLVRKDSQGVTATSLPINNNTAVYRHQPNDPENKPASNPTIAQKSNADCSNIFGQESYADLSQVSIVNDGNVHEITNLVFEYQSTTAQVRAVGNGKVRMKKPFSVEPAHFSTPVYPFDGYGDWISSEIDTDNDPNDFVEFEMTFERPVEYILMHFRSVHGALYEFVGSQHHETVISGGTEFDFDNNTRVLRDRDTKTKSKYSRDGYGTLLIYGTSSTFDKIIWRRKDDRTTNQKNDSNWFTFTEVVFCDDQDGDGAVDSVDEFPNDPSKAFTQKYPTASSKSTLAFEDLWPFTGDYDFNDTMLDYQITNYLDSSFRLVGIDFTYTVSSDGAGFSNGFALGIEGLSTNEVSSVEGQILNTDVFNVLPNGTEADQPYAVIPIFDDHSNLVGTEYTVAIRLNSAQSLEGLASLPYNPFLIANGKREMEIHLINQAVTALGNALPTVIGNNADSDGNFATDNGLPWAINVFEAFPVVKEKEPINEAYLFFEAWARSGGTDKKDWFKNEPGYRDNTKLE